MALTGKSVLKKRQKNTSRNWLRSFVMFAWRFGMMERFG